MPFVKYYLQHYSEVEIIVLRATILVILYGNND